MSANVLTRNTATANDANVPFVIENPPASHLWAMPCMHQQRPNAKGRLRGALSLSVSVVYGYKPKKKEQAVVAVKRIRRKCEERSPQGTQARGG